MARRGIGRRQLSCLSVNRYTARRKLVTVTGVFDLLFSPPLTFKDSFVEAESHITHAGSIR